MTPPVFTVAHWCVLIAALLPIACAGLAKSNGFGKPRREFARHAPAVPDVDSWEHFRACVEVRDGSFLDEAVKGFFANGGELCSIYPVDGSDAAALIQPFERFGALEDITGIDLVCEDISRPLEEQRGAIIEVNSSPGLLAHIKPAQGQPRPVGKAIVDHLFKDGETGRIPLVGVTGDQHDPQAWVSLGGGL